MKRAALEERRAWVQIRPAPLLALISSETHTLLLEAQFHTQETERGAVCRVSSRVLTPYNFNCRKIIPAAKLHYRDAESAVRPQERSSCGGAGGPAWALCADRPGFKVKFCQLLAVIPWKVT